MTYAPNARAWDVSRRQAATAQPSSLLTVDTAGSQRVAALPNIGHEVSAALRHFGRHRRLTGAECTVPNVLAALPDHPALHFACHGVANAARPLDSALLLADADLTLRDLMAQRLTSARIAVFISVSVMP